MKRKAKIDPEFVQAIQEELEDGETVTAAVGPNGFQQFATGSGQRIEALEEQVARLTRERDELRDRFNFAVAERDEMEARAVRAEANEAGMLETRTKMFELKEKYRLELAAAQAEVAELRRVLKLAHRGIAELIVGGCTTDLEMKAEMDAIHAALSAPTCAATLQAAIEQANSALTRAVGQLQLYEDGPGTNTETMATACARAALEALRPWVKP